MSADGAVAYAVQLRKNLTKDCKAIIVHLLNYTLCHVQGNSDTSEEGPATVTKRSTTGAVTYMPRLREDLPKEDYKATAGILIHYQKRQPGLSHKPLSCSGMPGHL